MRTIAFFGVAIIAVLAACGPASSQSPNNIRQCLSISNVDQRVGCLEAAAEDFRRGQQSAVPQSPFFPPGQPSLKEILDPVKDKLESCLVNHLKRASDSRINPSDFSRIIEGACYTEANDYHRALQQWWSSVSPRTTYEALTYSDKFIRSARNEIVSIYTQRWYAAAPKQNEPKSQQSASSGSGFIVNRSGQILSNNHVVKGCSKIFITTRSGQVSPAKIVAQTEADDLAILQSDVTTIEPAKFKFTPAPRIGEGIIVFGFPQLGLLASSGNVTNGIITGAVGFKDDARHVQISAPVQNGNSGGPLLDLGGNVVGVIVAKFGLNAAILLEDIPQNVGFAIKGAVVRSFLDINGISYSNSEAGPSLSIADVADRARGFSVAILCERNLATSEQQTEKKSPIESGGAQTPSQLSRRTAEFLVRMYSALSGPNIDAIKFANDTYVDNLQYFGKQLSRDQIRVELTRFKRRWPVCQYKMKESSVDIQCDESALVCAAKGTIEFDCKSPARNERSVGAATFEFKLSYTTPIAAPRITFEGGTVIERNKETLFSSTSGTQ